LGVELLCQRFDNARAKPGLGLSEHAIWFSLAIVGNRKLPIRTRYVVGDPDRAVLLGVLECVLEGIDDQ
jgi:hypothetical protein